MTLMAVPPALTQSFLSSFRCLLCPHRCSLFPLALHSSVCGPGPVPGSPRHALLARRLPTWIWSVPVSCSLAACPLVLFHHWYHWYRAHSVLKMWGNGTLPVQKPKYTWSGTSP
jgi:hypothetical protein